MNVEITFFLTNGESIGHATEEHDNVADAIKHYAMALHTSPYVYIEEDLVLFTKHVTHMVGTNLDSEVTYEEPTSEPITVPRNNPLNDISLKEFTQLPYIEAKTTLLKAFTSMDISQIAAEWLTDENTVIELMKRYDVKVGLL